jgi:hypothetical protein
MTTHVNRIANRPLVGSMDARRYKSADVVNLRGGYQEPSTISTQLFYHKNGQYVRPNKVALKYLDLKKDVDLDFHVRVFNFVVKDNAKTSKEYIINAFSYMLIDTMALNWCHTYMLKFPKYIFFGAYTCILQTSSKDLK